MISLFEVALEELEANFHIPPVSTHRPFHLEDGFHLQPRREREREREREKENPSQTSRQRLRFFPQHPRSGKTAASGLEFTGNNTGARARGDSSRREYTRRDKVSRRRDASASLATFKLPKPARSFRGLHEFSLGLATRSVASRRNASTRDVCVAATADKAPGLLGAHGAYGWNFT
jgi:hypothetical protein